MHDTELEIYRTMHAALEAGFARLPDAPGHVAWDDVRPVLETVARKMHDNFPYQHPLYAGQMLKPPHVIARLAYALAMVINPNNHALDGGRASSAMEKDAVAQLAAMIGWTTHLGHLCGGGTMANLEALWIARERCPGPVVASTQAHYTHGRVCGVLGVPFRTIATDARGRMDPDALFSHLQNEAVGTVVVTLGTTGVGAIDPLPDILRLRDEYGFRVHVDAAYGGYFVLANGLDADVRRAFAALPAVDSVVIDPHKHGLQPYGCGCVLFRDPADGVVYKHESRYTYFTSDELHLGEISLECSRPGATAVALWATQQLLPYVRDGEFAAGLDSCLSAARQLHSWLMEAPHFAPLFVPQLDIVVWACRADCASAASDKARRAFTLAAEGDLHLALAKLPRAICEAALPGINWDQEDLTCLRSCLMKPEHAEWLDEITTHLGHMRV